MERFRKDTQEKILLQYRLTYLAETEVNWCPGLGTVLANDESKWRFRTWWIYSCSQKMTQWSMRFGLCRTLLQGFNDIDWSKESQRNWIGKSVGATEI
jgi:leucyl-tRNA synthetase